MKWENFTAGRIAGFQCANGKKQSIFWDGKTSGLGLRVTPTGTKSYIFETSLNNKTIRITIGDISNYSIEAAREIATTYKAQTDRGIDPREVKAEAIAAKQAAKAAKEDAERAKQVQMQRQAITFEDVWAVYLETRKHNWGEGHYQNHLKLAAKGGEKRKRGKGITVAAPLAALMPLRLADLTSTTIVAWLSKEAQTRPTNAAQSFRILRALLSWVATEDAYKDLVFPDVCKARNVKDVIPKNNQKDDLLQREQLQMWFAATKAIANPVISAYLQALLITGARRRELSTLRWEDVDFQWNSLTIRDKVEGERTIPLTPYVSHLLNALPRRNCWVFSSPSASDGKLTEPRIAHTKALIAAGLPHLSLHGLRRSFGTLCEWTETPTGVVAQIMGHKPSATAEKHYRRRPLDMLRMWHVKIESWILEQAQISFVPSEIGLRAVK